MYLRLLWQWSGMIIYGMENSEFHLEICLVDCDDKCILKTGSRSTMTCCLLRFCLVPERATRDQNVAHSRVDYNLLFETQKPPN